MRAFSALVAIAVLATALGGCGGGSDSSSTTSKSPGAGSPAGPNVALENSAFGKRVTAVCFAGARALGSLPRFPIPTFDPIHPQVSQLPAVARFFQSGSLPAYEKLVAALNQVKPPAAAKPDYDEFVHQVERLVANVKRQIAAAKSSDAKGFVAAVKAGGGEGLPKAESALGISACYGVS